MRIAVITLRVLWGVLMAVFLYLIVTNSISAWGTVLYSLAVLTVMYVAMYLSSRRAGRRAAR
jgi:hypothetical protein